jgi:hypothetical protein
MSRRWRDYVNGDDDFRAELSDGFGRERAATTPPSMSISAADFVNRHENAGKGAAGANRRLSQIAAVFLQNDFFAGFQVAGVRRRNGIGKSSKFLTGKC